MIGYTFGLWPGALLAVAGSMTGAGVAFLSIRSIESVSFPSFMLANLLLQPRLLVPVFIGSRLVSLVDDGSNPDKPADPLAKWINLASILVGLSVSIGTGWFIYRATLQQMRDLGYEGVVSPEEAEEARDLLEENALLGDFSGDDDDEDGYNYDDAASPGNPLQSVGRSGRGFNVGGELERVVDNER
ncbi:hypothetical protein QFC22_005928 [Naganishia vaughanmartiniae]|uniref:Uncharacterized protein n=1 Tax=Naganishia vaughanmartiniae TaxID=1424756 RepID=A0ACC2WPC1_9TREE|nr:hypothetical protein QFC22_005928 [Naganishia vaughanmartiniae]